MAHVCADPNNGIVIDQDDFQCQDGEVNVNVDGGWEYVGRCPCRCHTTTPEYEAVITNEESQAR